MFTPSDFESAALDSEVEAEVERESERRAVVIVEQHPRRTTKGKLPIWRAARNPTLRNEKENNCGNDRAWEADLSSMVALRKREHFSRMETIRPSSSDHYQSHYSLGRSLSEVVPTYTEADNLLFHLGQPRLPPQLHQQNEAPDYESLEHGKAGYQTVSSDVDLASVDPLHFLSLLSLALSILPEIKTRIVAKIKFWILLAAVTLPRHSSDLDEKLGALKRFGDATVWDEGLGMVVESDVDRCGDGHKKPTATMLSLPVVRLLERLLLLRGRR
ncbi:hypothetical protein FRC01_005342 [Tulasnella sp. 417]|nr:hypothetical protein FRC01_005342 [Tulasnella sp. 417]